MTTLKTCGVCGAVKDVADYYAHPTTADRLQPKCKACLKAYTTERRRATGYASQRKYERANGRSLRRKHASARLAVFHAIKRGELQRQPCWVCGEKAQAHHPDYSQPLDVVWLCVLHHRQAHAIIRRIDDDQEAA